MIEFLKTTLDGTQKIDGPEAGCWINVVSPTTEERAWLSNSLDIMPEFIASSFDDNETSHVDYDDDTGQVLVVLDCPFVEEEAEVEDPSIIQYDTHPLSLLFLPERDCFVSVSLRENQTISAFAEGRVRGINTNQRTRMLLRMMLHVSQRYLAYLRSIERQFRENERKLHKTMRNNELIKMLGFEKSLVYFAASLKSTETTLQRIRLGRVLKLYEEDRDLVDDVAIEITQATEMCSILTNILNGTMDTFSNVISNNLNLTIRSLTIITIILAIPTIVFGFYGMNVGILPFPETWFAPFVIAAIGCTFAGVILSKGRWFR